MDYKMTFLSSEVQVMCPGSFGLRSSILDLYDGDNPAVSFETHPLLVPPSQLRRYHLFRCPKLVFRSDSPGLFLDTSIREDCPINWVPRAGSQFLAVCWVMARMRCFHRKRNSGGLWGRKVPPPNLKWAVSNSGVAFSVDSGTSTGLIVGREGGEGLSQKAGCVWTSCPRSLMWPLKWVLLFQLEPRIFRTFPLQQDRTCSSSEQAYIFWINTAVDPRENIKGFLLVILYLF